MSDKPAQGDWLSRAVHALRARNVDRIAVGYAVGGWLLVQAASIALPAFDVPAWGLRALIIFILTGFPIVVAIAWFASPHLQLHEVQHGRLGRRHALLGLFFLIVIAIAADLAYTLSRAQIAAPPQPVAARPAPPQHIAKNSIAVLPFVNMSGDPRKDYFSDGISEELLNDLSNTPALLVAARTSSFAFKGKNENVRDIARILSVRTILEGSVRESGEHIRITGQLINADDGYHLWSATYDRNLTDVLTVQAEIAQAITAALTHRLLPSTAHAASRVARTIDPEAYRMYLLGKHQLEPRDQAGSEAALASLTTVTALAPDFADGFAALARAQINVADYHPERADLIPAAQGTLVRALQLDPRNIDALSSRLDISLRKLDWASAIADANRLRDISPNSTQVLHEMFRYYWFLGFPELAAAAANGAVRLDPLSFVDRLNVMSFLLHSGRFADAVAAAGPALGLQKGQPLILSMQCAAQAYGGSGADALATETTLRAGGEGSDLQFCRFHRAAAAGRVAEAKAIADGLAQGYLHGGPSALELGELYAIIGERKQAIRWLSRSYDAKEYVLVLLPYERMVPQAFFDSPEWKAFYARPLFDDWRKAHDRVAADLAERG